MVHREGKEFGVGWERWMALWKSRICALSGWKGGIRYLVGRTFGRPERKGSEERKENGLYWSEEFMLGSSCRCGWVPHYRGSWKPGWRSWILFSGIMEPLKAFVSRTWIALSCYFKRLICYTQWFGRGSHGLGKGGELLRKMNHWTRYKMTLTPLWFL